MVAVVEIAKAALEKSGQKINIHDVDELVSKLSDLSDKDFGSW